MKFLYILATLAVAVSAIAVPEPVADALAEPELEKRCNGCGAGCNQINSLCCNSGCPVCTAPTGGSGTCIKRGAAMALVKRGGWEILHDASEM